MCSSPVREKGQMVYNKADELLTWPGMHTCTYYKDGSLNEEKDATGVTQRSYTYTDDGLLATATYPGGTAGFTWDADSNRVGMVMGGGTYSFVYDTTAGIPAVIEENDGANSVYYLREPGGSLLARLKGIDWRWYHFDELGSTRLLTDGSGVATDAYSYDAYGHLLSHTDPDPTDGVDMTSDNAYQYVGQLGYYAHPQDAGFGLLDLGVRLYSTTTGVFTQADPLGFDAGLNLYSYALSNPTTWTDASGMKTPPKDWAKRGWECSKKAFEACRSKKGSENSKCYWSTFATCMGKKWGTKSCEEYFCWLFPRDSHCGKGNPCDEKNPVLKVCQDCCEVKFYCCMIFSGGNAGKCYTEEVGCETKCEIKDCLKKR